MCNTRNVFGIESNYYHVYVTIGMYCYRLVFSLFQGEPGTSGVPGQPGPFGPPGPIGLKGSKGEPAHGGEGIKGQKGETGRDGRTGERVRSLVTLSLNHSHTKATFVQSTRMQKILKTI